MLNSGDIGFMIIAATYVFLMTPGLAFFYGGLAQRKNVLNTMMMSVAFMGLSSVLWVLCGYSLSFSGDLGGVIGNLKWFAFNGVGAEAGPYSDNIPNMGFALFQMMFAIITPSLITGAVAGRMKFKAIFLFVFLWQFVVYYPMAHMVWGGGFLAQIGSIDFAGGNVVHISSGVSGLVLAILIGKRKGIEKRSVVGLVAITPGAGFVPIWASFIIGALVSPICYFALSVLKPKFGYDDALDAFGCHGIGGIWGGIATGLFAQTSINPVAKWDGLVFGDYHLFVAQVLSILVTIAVAVVGTLICVGIVRLFTKLRVDENSENVGLDDSEHGERAYSAIWE